MRFRERRREVFDTLQTLQNVRLFAGCTEGELKRIASLFVEGWRPAGRVLVREDEPGLEFFVIVRGQVSVILHDETVATLGPGDFFGEMSLLDGTPRVASVVAVTDVRLLVIESRGFSALLSAVPVIGARMMRTLSQRLRTVEAATRA
ncbi:MAG: cyclic nucleotide-binding domain-containing protein [Actinomycetota bacterium]